MCACRYSWWHPRHFRFLTNWVKRVLFTMSIVLEKYVENKKKSLHMFQSGVKIVNSLLGWLLDNTDNRVWQKSHCSFHRLIQSLQRMSFQIFFVVKGSRCTSIRTGLSFEHTTIMKWPCIRERKEDYRRALLLFELLIIHKWFLKIFVDCLSSRFLILM